MPIFIRRREGDPGQPWLAEYRDKKPSWKTRRLSSEEIENTTTLLMHLMERSDFNHVQIAQVFYRGEDAKLASARVRKRLQRMRDAFAENGFKLGPIP